MAELLSQDEIIDKLHQDHWASKKFMIDVAHVLEPIYDEWSATHSWTEIVTGDISRLPALWPFITDHSADFDRNGYEKQCVASGISGKQAKDVRRVWLNRSFNAALYSDLHTTAPISSGLEDWTVTRAKEIIFSGQRLLTLRPGLSHNPAIGEAIITNLGEGDMKAYYALHTARYRCAHFIGKTLSPHLDVLAANNEDEISKLSRSVQVAGDQTNYKRPHYNPLVHTVLEGMLSVGQSVNYLVQGGIAGQISLLGDMRSLLANHAPAIMSRAIINGHIGPNQTAGLAVENAAIRSNDDAVINPMLVRALRTKRDSERASFQHLTEDDLEWLQDPEVQTVNRFEGCPANRLVRLMDRMLLDALSVED